MGFRLVLRQVDRRVGIERFNDPMQTKRGEEDPLVT